MSKERVVLKRGLVLGILWVLGSVQFLVRSETYALVFLVPLALGIAEVLLSVGYRTHSLLLTILLGLQMLYYLGCLVWVLLADLPPAAKVLSALAAVSMVLLAGSAVVTLRRIRQAA